MAKLWEKGYELAEEVEKFTVGSDNVLDTKLARYDVYGTMAHAAMLHSIGVLTEKEFLSVHQALVEILDEMERGDFVIRVEDEDVHTAVENRLTAAVSDAGKKIHTGRSRNDQVLVDIRMYSRDSLLDVWEAVLDLAEVLLQFAVDNEFVPMPGRTHMQRAMPSSVGTWAAAFVESLLDDLELLSAVYALNNQCPLGAAAGYGVKLPLNRALTSTLLGFGKVQNNVLYTQNSRGKFEGCILFALSQICDDLSRLAEDTILFSTPEFGYFVLPESVCPGSSIMPQKRNPDPLELVRARSSTVSSLLFRVTSIVRRLPSGYNRDVQETKGALMEAFDVAVGCLRVMSCVFEGLGVNEDRLRESFSGELFAADRATALALKGVPFRDAYKQVASQVDALEAEDPVSNLKEKSYAGAPGALGLDDLSERITREREFVVAERQRLANTFRDLVEGTV